MIGCSISDDDKKVVYYYSGFPSLASLKAFLDLLNINCLLKWKWDIMSKWMPTFIATDKRLLFDVGLTALGAHGTRYISYRFGISSYILVYAMHIILIIILYLS